jgi:FkbM family methyltransferase
MNARALVLSLRAYLKLAFGRGVFRSYAQYGEDAVIGAFFRKKMGVYVDVGAFHPTQYSNTYALYKRRWKGIAIDPSEQTQHLFSIMRPRDSFYQCAVGPKGEGTYHAFKDGAYNTLVSSPDSALKEAKHALSATLVAMRPLAEIVHDAQLSAIDFLSVDAEGMDLEVLKSHDWQIRPRVIAIEDHTLDLAHVQRSKIHVYLTSLGYALSARTGPTSIYTDTTLI